MNIHGCFLILLLTFPNFIIFFWKEVGKKKEEREKLKKNHFIVYPNISNQLQKFILALITGRIHVYPLQGPYQRISISENEAAT